MPALNFQVRYTRSHQFGCGDRRVEQPDVNVDPDAHRAQGVDVAPVANVVRAVSLLASAFVCAVCFSAAQVLPASAAAARGWWVMKRNRSLLAEPQDELEAHPEVDVPVDREVERDGPAAEETVEVLVGA
jgi:hypothetical protein